MTDHSLVFQADSPNREDKAQHRLCAWQCLFVVVNPVGNIPRQLMSSDPYFLWYCIRESPTVLVGREGRSKHRILEQWTGTWSMVSVLLDWGLPIGQAADKTSQA